MNTRRSRTLRTAWWLVLLLQLASPAMGAVADVLAFGARADSRVHFEPEHCAPSHPSDCAHCSVSRHAGPVADEFAPIFLVRVVGDERRRETVRRPAAFVAPSPLPRAPPALS